MGPSYWKTAEELTSFLCTCAHINHEPPKNRLGLAEGGEGNTDTLTRVLEEALSAECTFSAVSLPS